MFVKKGDHSRSKYDNDTIENKQFTDTIVSKRQELTINKINNLHQYTYSNQRSISDIIMFVQLIHLTNQLIIQVLPH